MIHATAATEEQITLAVQALVSALERWSVKPRQGRRPAVSLSLSVMQAIRNVDDATEGAFGSFAHELVADERMRLQTQVVSLRQQLRELGES